MEWNVLKYNYNNNTMERYNILKYEEDVIKNLKKKCVNKEEFASNLKIEIMGKYWARAEYEIIITRRDDEHIILTPWQGARNSEMVEMDVTDVRDFDWVQFAKLSIYSEHNKAKIDVYMQVRFCWGEFVDYCWCYHHKYQRKNIKFGVK